MAVVGRTVREDRDCSMRRGKSRRMRWADGPLYTVKIALRRGLPQGEIESARYGKELQALLYDSFDEVNHYAGTLERV